MATYHNEAAAVKAGYTVVEGVISHAFLGVGELQENGRRKTIVKFSIKQALDANRVKSALYIADYVSTHAAAESAGAEVVSQMSDMKSAIAKIVDKNTALREKGEATQEFANDLIKKLTAGDTCSVEAADAAMRIYLQARDSFPEMEEIPDREITSLANRNIILFVRDYKKDDKIIDLDDPKRDAGTATKDWRKVYVESIY